MAIALRRSGGRRGSLLFWRLLAGGLWIACTGTGAAADPLTFEPAAAARREAWGAELAYEVARVAIRTRLGQPQETWLTVNAPLVLRLSHADALVALVAPYVRRHSSTGAISEGIRRLRLLAEYDVLPVAVFDVALGVQAGIPLVPQEERWLGEGAEVVPFVSLQATGWDLRVYAYADYAARQGYASVVGGVPGRFQPGSGWQGALAADYTLIDDLLAVVAEIRYRNTSSAEFGDRRLPDSEGEAVDVIPGLQLTWDWLTLKAGAILPLAPGHRRPGFAPNDDWRIWISASSAWQL